MPFIFHCDSIFIHVVKVLLISPLYNCCFFFLTINNQSVGHNLRPCEYLVSCQNSLLDLAYIDNFCLIQSLYNGYNADFPASALFSHVWVGNLLSNLSKSLPFYLFFFSFFFNWRVIALQNVVVFCQTSAWISHRYTYIPSLLNLPPISLPIPPL